MNIQLIKDVMTPAPHSIGAEQNIIKAQELMESNQIRHLPVLKSGKIIGVLSDRDVKLAMGIMRDDEKKGLALEEFCQDQPYSVSSETPVYEVAAYMAEHRLGSALVEDGGGRLLGIFTLVDACRLLAKVLK